MMRAYDNIAHMEIYKIKECPECGARRGIWHHTHCSYRLFSLPADELIAQFIGDYEKHEKAFKNWKRILENKRELDALITAG